MAEGSLSRESFTPAEPSPWKSWLVGSLAAIVILGIALGLMKSYGLLDVTGDDIGAKTLAAALGLIGSVLTAAVTLVGTVVKYSIDDRSARLAAVEAGRNYALALDAEKRNRIEAAIRAVGLLSANNQDSTVHQIGGALLALVSLGEHDLAVALLNQLWSKELASAPVADVVLSRALQAGSEDTQTAAAAVLLIHADRIGQTGFSIWPLPRLSWRCDLPMYCRRGLVMAAVNWMKSTLAKDQNSIPEASIVLFQALNDSDAEVREYASASLRPLAQTFLPSRGLYGHLTVKEIAERLAQFPKSPSTTGGIRLESEIRKLLSPIEDDG
jgi:hypothetical protein